MAHLVLNQGGHCTRKPGGPRAACDAHTHTCSVTTSVLVSSSRVHASVAKLFTVALASRLCLEGRVSRSYVPVCPRAPSSS